MNETDIVLPALGLKEEKASASYRSSGKIH